MPGKPKDIDDYLTRVPEPQRAALQKMRQAIRSIVPKAEECISYSIPAFRLHGAIIGGFAAAKAHCSFYPFSGSTFRTLGDALHGYEKTKSALHFTPQRPLPLTLLRKLLRARIAEL